MTRSDPPPSEPTRPLILRDLSPAQRDAWAAIGALAHGFRIRSIVKANQLSPDEVLALLPTCVEPERGRARELLLALGAGVDRVARDERVLPSRASVIEQADADPALRGAIAARLWDKLAAASSDGTAAFLARLRDDGVAIPDEVFEAYWRILCPEQPRSASSAIPKTSGALPRGVKDQGITPSRGSGRRRTASGRAARATQTRTKDDEGQRGSKADSGASRRLDLPEVDHPTLRFGSPSDLVARAEEALASGRHGDAKRLVAQAKQRLGTGENAPAESAHLWDRIDAIDARLAKPQPKPKQTKADSGARGRSSVHVVLGGLPGLGKRR